MWHTLKKLKEKPSGSALRSEKGTSNTQRIWKKTVFLSRSFPPPPPSLSESSHPTVMVATTAIALESHGPYISEGE